MKKEDLGYVKYNKIYLISKLLKEKRALLPLNNPKREEYKHFERMCIHLLANGGKVLIKELEAIQ